MGEEAFELCTNQFAYKGIQALVREGRPYGSFRQLLETILNNSLALSLNEHSNFIVCEVIRKGPWEFQGRVASALTRTRDGMQRLCQEKYGPKQSSGHVARAIIQARVGGYKQLQTVYDEAHGV